MKRSEIRGNDENSRIPLRFIRATLIMMMQGRFLNENMSQYQ
ncbi:hypothetical protein CbuG_0778 [Coxiella burnetii CbuG_Q212]|uniref:Transposase n=1 Tax=Coxiella burnetii (strain Dugway 5J108-111) TaxID=434922 RepID=A9KFT1_COXBN|nr:hypothetical protein CBUD_1317 [Coxiella burnetii Dugway 5J108-111]ACJ18174.1 hypothetical protein CbuG_0778 [Coxiella burnetii CbuG_Q212]